MVQDRGDLPNAWTFLKILKIWETGEGCYSAWATTANSRWQFPCNFQEKVSVQIRWCHSWRGWASMGGRHSGGICRGTPTTPGRHGLWLIDWLTADGNDSWGTSIHSFGFLKPQKLAAIWMLIWLLLNLLLFQRRREVRSHTAMPSRQRMYGLNELSRDIHDEKLLMITQTNCVLSLDTEFAGIFWECACVMY